MSIIISPTNTLYLYQYKCTYVRMVCLGFTLLLYSHRIKERIKKVSHKTHKINIEKENAIKG